MTFDAVTVKKIVQTNHDGEAPYSKGLIACKAEFSADVRKALKAAGVSAKAIEKFTIRREILLELAGENEAVSLTFSSASGRDLCIPDASIHQVNVKADASGEFKGTIQASFDSRYGKAVSEWGWENPGWFGQLEVTSSQGVLQFEPPTDEGGEEEESQSEAA